MDHSLWATRGETKSVLELLLDLEKQPIIDVLKTDVYFTPENVPVLYGRFRVAPGTIMEVQYKHDHDWREIGRSLFSDS